jgi:spore germination protein GerM
MSRDPFESLRGSNPLPEDHPVHPPMAIAERILGGAPRRAWPAWALATGLAAAVLVGGGAWLLWIHGGPGEVVATSAATPTTGGAVTAAASTTTSAPILTGDAVVYFFISEEGSPSGPGPYLIPVAQSFSVLSHPVSDPVAETLSFLLAGPWPGVDREGPALSSYLPLGTRLLAITVADGIATVDLSSELEAAQGLAGRGALAQIVFTLTRFDAIEAVRVLIDGVPVTAALVAAPQEVADTAPLTRADFADELPAIMLESPAYWASSGDNPLVVTGTADVFEATVSLELLGQDGAVLWQGTTQASCGTGCRGDFSAEIPYEVAEGQFGTLVAWEASMEDGSRLYQRQHLVWLNASGDSGPPTAAEQLRQAIAEQMALRYDLDKALDSYLAELAAVDAQLVGLPLDQGTELRTRAAELDRQVAETRDGLSRVFDQLRALGVDFEIPCSGAAASPDLPDEPGLPAPVASLRRSIFEAARACDWQTLRGVMVESTFSYSFGESGDPVGFWQREEFLHYQPMLYIAGMLARPYGTVPGDVVTIFAWPSAQAYASWADVPQPEREALRPLYGDGDFASFAEFGGYLGYRVGFSWDGTRAVWIYAITGD